VSKLAEQDALLKAEMKRLEAVRACAETLNVEYLRNLVVKLVELVFADSEAQEMVRAGVLPDFWLLKSALPSWDCALISPVAEEAVGSAAACVRAHSCPPARARAPRQVALVRAIQTALHCTSDERERVERCIRAQEGGWWGAIMGGGAAPS
jgi:hypothetical protein